MRHSIRVAAGDVIPGRPVGWDIGPIRSGAKGVRRTPITVVFACSDHDDATVNCDGLAKSIVSLAVVGDDLVRFR